MIITEVYENSNKDKTEFKDTPGLVKEFLEIVTDSQSNVKRYFVILYDVYEDVISIIHIAKKKKERYLKLANLEEATLPVKNCVISKGVKKDGRLHYGYFSNVPGKQFIKRYANGETIGVLINGKPVPYSKSK